MTWPFEKSILAPSSPKAWVKTMQGTVLCMAANFCTLCPRVKTGILEDVMICIVCRADYNWLQAQNILLSQVWIFILSMNIISSGLNSVYAEHH